MQVTPYHLSAIEKPLPLLPAGVCAAAVQQHGAQLPTL